MDTLKNKSLLKLQLGDIIELKSKSNFLYNNHVFYINYIDQHKVVLLDVNNYKTYTIFIDDETHNLDDNTIDEIILLSRASSPSYAKQHGLNTGVWVNILMDDGNMPIIITGEIVNVIEDMIEVRIYPTNENIYIDFAYKGLPENLPIPIKSIEIRNAPLAQDINPTTETPPPLSTDADAVAVATEAPPPLTPNAELGILPTGIDTSNPSPAQLEEQEQLEGADYMKMLSKSREIILNENDIKFDENADSLNSIVQYVNVAKSEQKYALEVQLQDILDDYLTTIPTNKRTDRIKNIGFTLLMRYKELRESFIEFDDNNNVVGAKITTFLTKPLCNWFDKFDYKLTWIYPVVKLRKNIYYSSLYNETDITEDDNIYVNPILVEQDLKDMVSLINNYKGVLNNAGGGVELINKMNKLSLLYINLDKFFRSTDNTLQWDKNDNIFNKRINYFDGQVVGVGDNFGFFLTECFKKNALFFLQTYIDGIEQLVTKGGTGVNKHETEHIKLTQNDEMSITSFAVTSLNNIIYSKLYLKMGSIYDKIHYNMIMPFFSSTFNSETDVRKMGASVKSIDFMHMTEKEMADERNKNKNFIFIGGTVPRVLNIVPEIDDTDPTISALTKDEQYKNYVYNLLPYTTNIINSMTKHFNVSKNITIANLIYQLEGFLIYKADIMYENELILREYNKTAIAELKQMMDYVAQKLAIIKKYGRALLIAKTVQFPTLYDVILHEDARENIINTYDIANYVEKINDDEKNYLYSNGEVVLAMREIDEGKYYNGLLSLQNMALMIPETIMEIMNIYNGDGTGTGTGEASNEEQRQSCEKYEIAKIYNNLEDLKRDNDQTTYFDKKYDTTNYLYMEKFNKEVGTMNIDELKKFLYKEIKKDLKISDDDTLYLIKTLLEGRKEVKNGQYAIYYASPSPLSPSQPSPKTQIQYYVRRNNKWEQTDKLPINGLNTLNSNLLCNLQNECIDKVANKINVNDKCEPFSRVNRDYKEYIMKQISNEFDLSIKISMNELRQSIEKNIKRDQLRMGKLKQQKLAFKLLENDYKIKLMEEYRQQVGPNGVLKEEIKSPYLKLRNMILEETDFVKRQSDIVLFVNTFTRNAYTHIELGPLGEPETDNWLYCVKTNVPLLPTFIYKLAATYVEMPEKYQDQLNMIITKIGKLSDDGNMWVDMHSGWPITMIKYSSYEGYDDAGYKIKHADVLEKDVDELLEEQWEKMDAMAAPVAIAQQPPQIAQLTKIMPTDTLAIKIIKIILNYISGLIGVNIIGQYEFIIRNVIEIFESNLPNEAQYKKLVQIMAANGKKIPSYEEVYNNLILFLTLGMFIVAVQTNVPNIISRKTFPNCVRSFSGYPLDGEGDMGMINYVACILGKIKNTSLPWNVIHRKPDIYISQKIKEHLDKYILPLNEVKHKIEEKAQYLQSHVDEIAAANILEIYNASNLWNNFLPPLKPFTLYNTPPQPLADGFKTTLINDIKNSSIPAKFIADFDTIKIKIIEYSFYILQNIQDVISSQELLLNKISNEPYLENACCLNGTEFQTTIAYFGEKKPDIFSSNSLVQKYARFINDINKLIKARQLWCPIIDKILYSEMPAGGGSFSERTIYNVFITYCNFKNTLPIPANFFAFCKEKPTNIEPNETLNDTIIKLKTDNYHYTMEKLLPFLQMIGVNGHINYSIKYEHITPLKQLKGHIKNMENIFNRNVIFKSYPFDSVKHGVLQALTKFILDKTNEFEMEEHDKQNLKVLNNILLENLPKMRQFIIDFIGKNTQNKVKVISGLDMRHINAFLFNIDKWKEDVDKPSYATNVFNKFDYFTNIIKYVTGIWPTLIQNQTSFNNADYMKNWNLAEKHYADLQAQNTQYYELIYSTYSLNVKSILTFIPYLSYYLYPLIDNLKYILIFERSCLYVYQYLFLQSLIDYINLSMMPEMTVEPEVFNKEYANNIDFIYSNDSLETYSDAQIDFSSDEIMHQSKIKTNNTSVAYLLFVYMQYCLNLKADFVDTSNEDIYEIVYKTKEREKEILTDRLKLMAEDARQVDKIFQNLKIGEFWGRGLQKGLLVYDKDQYDNPLEMSFVEEMQKVEANYRNNYDDFEAYMENKLNEAELDMDAYAIEMNEDGEGEEGDYDNFNYGDD